MSSRSWIRAAAFGAASPLPSIGRTAAVGVSLLLLLGSCHRQEETSAASPPLPVGLETVEAGPFQPTLHLLGVVEPSGSVVVTAQTDSPVEYPSAFPDGLRAGVRVKAGQLLAWQRDKGSEHQADVARLKAEAAARELERHQESWQQGLESAATFETYKLQAALARQQRAAAEDELVRLKLRAPVGGRLKVPQRYPPGAEVAAGTPLAEILTDERQVRGWVGADDRDRLAVGQTVRIDVARLQEPPVSGTIREVGLQASQGGAFSVVVQPEVPGRLPSLGEGVEMEVLLEKHLQTLTVPEEAVVLTADGASVFVAVRSAGKLQAERRSITLGERAGDERAGGQVEVLQGLTRGDRVVIAGASLLSDGAEIVAVEGQAASGGAKDETRSGSRQ